MSKLYCPVWHPDGTSEMLELEVSDESLWKPPTWRERLRIRIARWRERLGEIVAGREFEEYDLTEWPSCGE
jgi:hypothetical protein